MKCSVKDEENYCYSVSFNNILNRSLFFITYSCWLITYFFCKKIINCWRHFFAANDPFRGGNTGGNCRLPPLIPRAEEPLTN